MNRCARVRCLSGGYSVGCNLQPHHQVPPNTSHWPFFKQHVRLAQRSLDEQSGDILISWQPEHTFIFVSCLYFTLSWMLFSHK